MNRNKHLLIQYGIIFFIMFFILIAGIVYLARLGFREQAKQGESETAYSQAYQVTDFVTEFKDYPFLIEYWNEHKDELTNYDEKVTKIIKDNPELLKEFGVFSVYEITMDDIETMSDEQKYVIAMMSYMMFDNQFKFIKSIEKSTLDGPIFVSVNEDNTYTVLADVSENGFTPGEEILYKKAQKTFDHKKDDPEDVHDNIFSMRDKEDDFFTGMIAPVLYEDKMIAFTIIEIREDYLKKISFKYTNMIVGVIIVFVLTMCAFILYFLHKTILKPLAQVQNALRIYANTLDTEILISKMKNIRSNNEIGRLADEVAKMARQISGLSAARIDSATEKARQQLEIDFASEIQDSMLPDDFPDSSEKRFDMFGHLIPKETVGADIYDYIYIDDDHVALVIADVSGSGMSAALFMMETISQIKNKAEQGKSPADILAEVNCDIIEHSKDELFITVWLMVIELSTGKAIEANAGHVKPVFCKNGEQYDFVKNKSALPLGVSDTVTYTETKWQLMPGDKIFIYTDGVTGAQNAEKKLFGTGRLKESLNEVKDKSQVEILDHVKEKLEEFLGKVPIADDLTMLGFTYKGPEN